MKARQWVTAVVTVYGRAGHWLSGRQWRLSRVGQWLWQWQGQGCAGTLTAAVVALVMANGGSEQMAGTTAATEAGKLRETAAVTRVSLGRGDMK